MDNKYYIKRNINNQVTKITNENIKFLDNNFKLETSEEDLFSLIRSTDESTLGDFFQNSRYGKLPFSAKFLKKFTLCSLYKVEILSKEEFNKLQQKEKFEFIITQRTVAWVNLLDKSEVVGFLKFCNIHCEDSNTIAELRHLASSAIKSFRRDQNIDETETENLNDTELTFIEGELSINSNNSGDNLVNVTFIEDDQKNTKTDNVDTLSIGHKIKNLLDDLRTSDETENLYYNSNLNKNNQSLGVIEKAEILNLDINFKSNNIKSEVENNKVTSEIKEQSTVDNNLKTIINKNKFNLKPKMAFKMVHQPSSFSADLEQDVEIFFENFDLAAIINEWGDLEKITLLPIYLKGTAEKFFRIIKSKNRTITWDEAKLQLKEKFTTVGNNKRLQAQLYNRKLKEGEGLNEFVIDIIDLCNRIDRDMKEGDICENILRGLSKEVYETIKMLDNSTIKGIENNLKKYEMALLTRLEENRGSRDTERMESEIEILKKQVRNLSMGQESGYGSGRPNSNNNNFTRFNNNNSYTRNQNNRNFRDNNFNNYNNRPFSNNNQRYNNNNNFNNNGNSNGPQNFNNNYNKNRNFQRNYDHYENNNNNNVDRHLSNTHNRRNINNNFDNQHNESYYNPNQNRSNDNYYTNNSNRNNDFSKNNTFSGKTNNGNISHKNSNIYSGQSGSNRQDVRLEEVNTNFIRENSRHNSIDSNKNVPNQKN